MKYDRVEIRLDGDRRRRLSEIAAEYETSLSDAVRTMIDEAYEEVVRARRLEAARRLAALEVETPPEPEDLAHELERAHEPRLP